MTHLFYHLLLAPSGWTGPLFRPLYRRSVIPPWAGLHGPGTRQRRRRIRARRGGAE